MNGQHSFKEEDVDTYFPELVDRNSWYVPGWVGGGRGWRSGRRERAIDNTILKKKMLILTFQNWWIETDIRSLGEGVGRRGKIMVGPSGVREGGGADEWTTQF